MSAVCEIAPQNGVGEHESPLSSPDCEQPKGKVIPSDDSGIGMDDSHVFSMDQSATSDELNAITPDSEIAEDTIIPQQKQETEQTNSLLESFPKKSENGTEAADDSEISQNNQPQEETRTVQVTEEVSNTQFTESIPNGDIKTEVQHTETSVTTTVTESEEPEEPEVEEETIVPKKKEDEPQLSSSSGEGEMATDECEVKITVTEAEDTQSIEEVEPEPEPEPEPEEPRVDFVRGIKCDNVDSALEILKTRYRLSDVTVKKCIITWSCWNLPDLVIKRPLSDWRGSPDEVPDLPENEALKADSMVDHINTKEEEIDKLVKEVLRAEEDKKRDSGKPGKLEPVQEEDVIVMENAPAAESAPTDGEPKKKKKRNIFTRMVHALRKRFSSGDNRRSRA